MTQQILRRPAVKGRAADGLVDPVEGGGYPCRKIGYTAQGYAEVLTERPNRVPCPVSFHGNRQGENVFGQAPLKQD